MTMTIRSRNTPEVFGSDIPVSVDSVKDHDLRVQLRMLEVGSEFIWRGATAAERWNAPVEFVFSH